MATQASFIGYKSIIHLKEDKYIVKLHEDTIYKSKHGNGIYGILIIEKYTSSSPNLYLITEDAYYKISKKHKRGGFMVCKLIKKEPPPRFKNAINNLLIRKI